MKAHGLADTGAILALLDRRENRHQECHDAFRHLRLPLLTSEAVLTEVFYMAGSHPTQREAAWKFACSGALTLATISDADLPALHLLMIRYADRPMDFADATLVYLAERESLTTIFTIDHDDFETYRIAGKKRFRIVPGRRQ